MNKRPTFLTIWLVLLTIGGIIALRTYILDCVFILGYRGITKPFLMFADFGMIIMNLVSVGMLWRWKKLGFYIAVVCLIITVLANIISNSGRIIVVVFALLSVGILYLAMKPVWKNFK